MDAVRDFVALDFETANPKRVSACALGYALVINGELVEANGYLMKPVGGHAPFQSKIHGITEEDTFDKPDFGRLFPAIRHIFGHTLVAHSLFDRQVLLALAEHFALDLDFEYFDTSALAKQKLPTLKNHKLKTLAKHFRLPKFRHHDAMEDATACAHICLRLHEIGASPSEPNAEELQEFKGLIAGITADDEVNYKEAYELLYWMEDHPTTVRRFEGLYRSLRHMLQDDDLDALEACSLHNLLRSLSEGIRSKQERRSRPAMHLERQ